MDIYIFVYYYVYMGKYGLYGDNWGYGINMWLLCIGDFWGVGRESSRCLFIKISCYKWFISSYFKGFFSTCDTKK